jgi:hypothetical protein
MDHIENHREPARHERTDREQADRHEHQTWTDPAEFVTEWGPAPRTRTGHKLVVRRIGDADWVICENQIGKITRGSIHGFVRQLGEVWEVVSVHNPLIRAYCSAQHEVMHSLVVQHQFLPPLPVHELVERPEQAYTDDELGVLAS